MGVYCARTNIPITNAISHFYPKLATITAISDMTKMEKLFTIELDPHPQEPYTEENNSNTISYKPCQFLMLSAFGYGEAPISICSGPNDPKIKMCIRKVGSLTNHFHNMKVGDKIGIRGPYGNGFPVEKLIGKDILLIAGGLGLAPLRSLIRYILHDRYRYNDFTLLYGTKSEKDRLFTKDLEKWKNSDKINLYETIDIAESDWHGNIGLVTGLFKYLKLDHQNTIAFVIGPPVMYRFVLRELLKKEIPTSAIYMDFERRMKCGIQKCGHCQVNGAFICNDGPVLNYQNMIKTHLKEAL